MLLVRGDPGRVQHLNEMGNHRYGRRSHEPPHANDVHTAAQGYERERAAQGMGRAIAQTVDVEGKPLAGMAGRRVLGIRDGVAQQPIDELARAVTVVLQCGQRAAHGLPAEVEISEGGLLSEERQTVDCLLRGQKWSFGFGERLILV